MLETSRHRATDGRNASRGYWEDRNSAGVITQGSILSGISEGSYKAVDDVPTLHFKKKMRSGQFIFNDFVLEQSDRTCEYGHIRLTFKNGCYNDHAGALIGFINNAEATQDAGPKFDLAHMGDIALTKAHAKVYAAPVLGGEILSDIDKTLSLLQKPISSGLSLAQKMYKTYAKKKGKTLASHIKAKSAAWLEYRYGWMPLVLDSKETIKQVHRIRGKYEKIHLVARTAELDYYNGTRTFAQVPLSGWSSALKASGTRSVIRSAKVCAGIVYGVEPRTTTEDLASTFGFSSKSLVPTAWEIIPYSFVVDWFINIGDWLQMVNPDPKIKIYGSWLTTVEKLSESLQASLRCDYIDTSDNNRALTVNGDCGKTVYDLVKVTRDANPPIPVTPVLTTGSLSALHSVDALALSLKPLLKVLGSMR